MTNLDKIPTQDNYKTTLTNKLSTTGLTVEVKDVPSYLPTTTETFAIINGGKSNAECVIIEDYDATNKTITIKAGGRGQSLKKGVAGTAYEHVSGSSLIISDNFGFWEDIQEAINSKNDSLGNKADVYANATARDEAITSPDNGMQVYLTDTGKFYDYTAGSWVERESGGTFANASETVAGKVEIATTEEVLAGTGTGGTGAKLSISPDNGAITATAQTAGGYIPKTNSSGVVSKELIEGLKGTGATVTSANLDTLTDGSVADSLHTHSALGVITATAGEDIDGSTTPKACFISSGDVDVSTEITVENTSSGGTYVLNNTTKRLSQSITVGDTVFGLKDLTVYWQRFGASSTLNLRLEIFASDSNDKPTGSALQTINVTTSGPGSGSSVFTGVLLLPNTKYCFVISSAAADGTNYYNIFTDLVGGYADGKFHYSEDGGANYVLSATDLKFTFIGYGGYEEGKIYMSKSDNVYRNFFDFFISEAVTKGNSITFEDKKKVSGFSGLTPNKFYEISSTNGGVTATTINNMFVASSSTELNVFKKKTLCKISSSGSVQIPKRYTFGIAYYNTSNSTKFYKKGVSTVDNYNRWDAGVFSIENLQE